MSSTGRNHLKKLESEAIFVMREVAAQFERPALLFSGGKDSIILVRLAQKAFAPAKIPFPLVHIDTEHNFPEAIEYRNWLAQDAGAHLIVGNVGDDLRSGEIQEEKGHNPSRNALQTYTLLKTIEKYKFDACFGGARRDEEKARAKERFFSHRDDFGQWDPKNQRPELWNLFNGRHGQGEHFRVFPISNWTEMDVWQYIKQENIALPSIYFSHSRPVLKRDNMWLAIHDGIISPRPNEEVINKVVRCRTVGDITCTGMVESPATTLDEIIQEVASARVTERGGRADDKRSETAMENRKKEGYF